MHARGPRQAFTLLELLVSIAIIGILLALLLPAVQQVRESANRTVCENNLRQIGYALQMYHDDHGKFPPAFSQPQYNVHGQPFPAPDNWLGISWMARILPYIQQDNLYIHIKPGDWPWWHPYPPIPGVGYLNGVSIKLYLCPSDPRSAKRSGPYHDPVYDEDMYVAFTDYLGVNGQNQFTYDGIIYINSSVRIAAVTDGTSNTLLVGERPPSYDEYWGWWFAGSGPYPWFGAGDVVSGSNEKIPVNGECTPNGPESCYKPGKLIDPDGEHTWHFWSLHKGGSNFLFADVSVHHISYSIGGDVLRKLATRANGEVVSYEGH